MSENIDKLFKKALQEQECNPPAYVWEGIQQQLNKRPRMIGKWWLRGIAAAVIVICIGLWQLLYTEEQMQVADNSILTLQPEVAVPDTRPEVSVAEKEVAYAEESNVRPTITSATDVVAPTPALKRIAPVSRQTSYTNVLIAENSNFELKNLTRDFIPLTSGDAIKNQQEYRLLIEGKKDIKKEKEHAKVTLSGHFTPTYSAGNYSSSVKNTRGFNYSNSDLNGMMNVGGGMKISITPRKRLSFQTGIFYSRMGQRSTEDKNAPRIAAFSTDNAAPRVSTPLGNIHTDRKAVSYRTAKAIVLSSISDNNETLEQVFGSIEIPLHVRYQLNDNKVQFSLSGGLSGGILVNNKVFMKASGDKELLGSTENIRKFNLSTDLGLGVEYPLGRKVKLMVEPGFRYFLQSLSKNDLIDFKPYTFTLSTGIGIEF